MAYLSRRQFMRFTAGLGLSAAGGAILEKLALTQAWAQTPDNDYKALVCIFLAGGNDGNQVVVPLSGAPGFGSADVVGGYPAYSAERRPQGLALTAPPATGVEPATALQRITAGAANPDLGMFGMNPNLALKYNSTTGSVTIQVPSLKDLYAAGKAAVVCNVGTLVQPLSKEQFLAYPTLRPDQLFSHSDQVRGHQTCLFHVATPAGVPGGTGWGGRTADKVTLNGTSVFPMQTSVAGAPQFMSGSPSFPIAINPAPSGLNQVLVLDGFFLGQGIRGEEARKSAFDQLRAVNLGTNQLVDANSKVMNDALAVSAVLTRDPELTVPDPAHPTTKIAFMFPNTTLGNQLKQVAKLIKANLTQPLLGLKRQIFFCQMGGFDTHELQNSTQPALLTQLNQALGAFYYWLEHNVPTNGTSEPVLDDLTSKVTSFTMSDFGRTFSPSGTGYIVGSDHAWGNHWMVVGGAVNGNQLYGVPLLGGNNTVFPTLSRAGGPNGPFDYDVDGVGGRGRWIPSVSTLQYACTLSAWFGLPQADMGYVFPYLSTNFDMQDLGFMNGTVAPSPRTATRKR